MKKAGAICSILILVLLIVLIIMLPAKTPAVQSGFLFHGIPWGEQASDIVRSAQSEDYFLVSEGSSANTIYGFDKEASLVMGGYAILPEAPEYRAETVSHALNELTGRFGTPTAEIFRDSAGASSNSWDAAINHGGTAQFFWITPALENCCLEVSDSGPVIVRFVAPGIEQEQDTRGLEEFPWGAPIDDIAGQMDWNLSTLVQGTVFIAGSRAAVIYHFDESGTLFEGEYMIAAEDIEDANERWPILLDWLKEEYGLTIKGGDEQQLPHDAQWNIPQAQITVRYESGCIRLLFTESA